MRYGNAAFIFNNTWYAIKIIESNGYSDRNASWDNNSSYLFYMKVSSSGAVKADKKILGMYVQNIMIDRDTLELYYGSSYTEKNDFEILYCDDHFLKIRDKNQAVYYFVSDSKSWERN